MTVDHLIQLLFLLRVILVYDILFYLANRLLSHNFWLAVLFSLSRLQCFFWNLFLSNADCDCLLDLGLMALLYLLLLLKSSYLELSLLPDMDPVILVVAHLRWPFLPILLLSQNLLLWKMVIFNQTLLLEAFPWRREVHNDSKRFLLLPKMLAISLSLRLHLF